MPAYIKTQRKGGENPMYIKNKLSALLLAAVLSVSAVAPSFAANSSPSGGGGGGGGGLTYISTPETETPPATSAAFMC